MSGMLRRPKCNVAHAIANGVSMAELECVRGEGTLAGQQEAACILHLSPFVSSASLRGGEGAGASWQSVGWCAVLRW